MPTCLYIVCSCWVFVYSCLFIKIAGKTSGNRYCVPCEAWSIYYWPLIGTVEAPCIGVFSWINWELVYPAFSPASLSLFCLLFTEVYPLIYMSICPHSSMSWQGLILWQTLCQALGWQDRWIQCGFCSCALTAELGHVREGARSHRTEGRDMHDKVNGEEWLILNRILGMMTWDSESHPFLYNTIGQLATPTRKLAIIPDSSSPAAFDENAPVALQPAMWNASGKVLLGRYGQLWQSCLAHTRDLSAKRLNAVCYSSFIVFELSA